MHHRPISFPHWKSVLAQAPLESATKAAYTREILGFLKHCKSTHAAATVEVAKRYLDWRERQSGGLAREALRWFYRLGRLGGGSARNEGAAAGLSRVGAPVRARSDIPPKATDDLGASPWERDLIKAIRERGFLWRTEQTYRAWAVRFARFIAPRSPYAAAGEEVAAFLSALAVEGRASPAAQKQALNALVFLMQEALGRQLGEIDFRRPPAGRRIPTVLTREECARLFGQMDGTFRLMAELMYGSGLRLMELLRLHAVA